MLSATTSHYTSAPTERPMPLQALEARRNGVNRAIEGAIDIRMRLRKINSRLQGPQPPQKDAGSNQTDAIAAVPPLLQELMQGEETLANLLGDIAAEVGSLEPVL